MQILRFTIAPGGSNQYELGGRHFEVVRAAGTLNIRFIEGAGQEGKLWQGAVAGYFAAIQYTGFRVFNPEPFAQTVELLISDDGQAGYRGIPNTLNATIDGAATTERGAHFIGYTSAASPELVLIDSSTAAGLAVHELHITAGIASEVTVFTAQNATAVVLATLLPAPPAGFQSMVAGAADSTVGRKRTATSATLTARKDVAPLRAAANVTSIWRPAVPFVITGTNLVGVACVSGSVFVSAVVEQL